MAAVYRAVDTRLNRVVAIKVLHRDTPTNTIDEEQRLRFDREVRAIANTTHPHICALFDVGHEGDLDYLVMEYLQGQTLAERIRKGRLPIDEVLLYGSQLASALGHVHRHGFVHRDVKPSNVMITDGEIKLLDFGIAKRSEALELTNPGGDSDAQTLTLAGGMVGTVQYMAPEQLEGFESDPRTDIFAVGLILYEMATGARAFSAQSTAGTIAAILSAEPAPLNLPPFSMLHAFEHAVRKCLARQPDDRWQSID